MTQAEQFAQERKHLPTADIVEALNETGLPSDVRPDGSRVWHWPDNSGLIIDGEKISIYEIFK
ncbi:MAG: hypothetical protein Kow0060_01700 [Methylohalobius crimeensis]